MDESGLAPLTAKFGRIRFDRNQAIKHPAPYPPTDTTRIRELPAFARTYGIDRLNITSACGSGDPTRATGWLIAHTIGEKFRAGASHCTFTTRDTQADLELRRHLLHRAARDIAPIDYDGNNGKLPCSNDTSVTRSHIPAVITSTIGLQHLNDTCQAIAAAVYAHPL